MVTVKPFRKEFVGLRSDKLLTFPESS